jgi:hypothetical protein
MDTKFWGPSGWKLLHTLTLAYEPQQKAAMATLFELLPYVLPCKFCRHSLTEYYEELPIDLSSKQALVKWLWKIHGKVNDKLRKQGQKIPADPTLQELKQIYGKYVPGDKPNPCESFPGWDFLFSIAYNHPLNSAGSPMPDAPKDLKGSSDATLNKWNLLSNRRRYCYWRRFWPALAAVLPSVWAKSWAKAAGVPCTANRRSTVAWLWRTRCKFADGADPYKSVCHKLATYESGCSKSTRARTCRRLKGYITQNKRTHKKALSL